MTQLKFRTKLIIFLAFYSLHLIADDSIKVQRLDEVVVRNSRSWVDGNKIVFVPTRHEKNLSNSPESLLKNMHLPVIRKVNGTLKGRNGEDITIFINGVKANNVDLSTFWPKEVRRVEYFEDSSDPAFEGARTAVNLVTTKYILGGVTKINLYQKIPDFGNNSVSSKAVYKKMTYGVLLNGNFFRDHRTNTSGSETYSNLFYNNVHYDNINRVTDEHSWSKEDAFSSVVNARYQTERFRATHTLALNWKSNPGSGSNSVNTWTPAVFASPSAYGTSKDRSVTPQISGEYYASFSNKWSATGHWSYAFSRNHVSSINSLGGKEDFYNHTTENVNSVKAVVNPYYLASKNWTFAMTLSTAMDWYSSQYSGTSLAHANQRRGESKFNVKAFWQPSYNLQLSLAPGGYLSYWKVGNERSDCFFRPTVNASAYWNPDKKLSCGFNSQFYSEEPGADQSSDVIIKQSELIWAEGNPTLKNLTSLDNYLYTTWLPKDWLSMNLGFGYTRTTNSIVPLYMSQSNDYGGIAVAYTNAMPVDHLRANYEISFDLFNDDLSISATPEWYYTKTRGEYATNFNYLSFSADADYTIGNCRIKVWYDGPYKDVDMAGMEKTWKQGRVNAQFTYGNGNMFLEFTAENILNDKSKSWDRINSNNYSSSRNILATGRTFAVNLTYTFSYGKKTDRGFDFDNSYSAKSSIVGVKR